MPRVSRRGAAAPLDAAAVFAPLAEFGTIGLAVSGGADSLALMLLAHRYVAGGEGALRFIVYTVDHGLRPEAAAEAAFVVAEAEKLGFAARLLHWTGRKPQTGRQAAARVARYRLIGAAMAADRTPVLVTGHHLHDQAETVLMRLAHGSGLGGLRGMDYLSEVEGVQVVRPLLGVDPSTLRAIVEASGLKPVADPSNADPHYERVRWRQLLPQLEALGLTPQRLALFALRARHADRALATLADEFEMESGDGPIILEAPWLRSLPRALAVRAIQRALGEVGGRRKSHALLAVELLTSELVQGPVATTLNGCLIHSDGTFIRIAPEPLSGARAKRSGIAST